MPVGHVEHDRVRVSRARTRPACPDLRAIADADDVELALEAFGHAEHAVGREAARQAVKLAELGILRIGAAFSCPSTTSNAMPGGIRCVSLPFGP